MKQTMQKAAYPVFVLEVNRNETSFRSLDAIVDHLKQQIETSEMARLITVFDHYGHTRHLPQGQIDPDILAAKNILFCFGLSLPEPSALALRPRSLGVAETRTGFVVSFMESPMPVVNQALENWVMALVDRRGRLSTEAATASALGE